MVQPERIFKIKTANINDGNVVYWMSRDQRSRDNWALLHAFDLALQMKSELSVVFCLSDNFPGANIRHYDFMLEGLNEVSSNLQLKNIPFYLLQGDPVSNLRRFIVENKVSHLVCDFDPVRIKRQWKQELSKETEINIYEVDAHNIVPARVVSNKVEFGAYTIRPKINRLLNEYLIEFPDLPVQEKTGTFRLQQTDWVGIYDQLEVDKTVLPVEWIHPGEGAAMDMMKYFLGNKISNYARGRNDPNEDYLSNLSPYLHFGQIASQRIALETKKQFPRDDNAQAFLEELIIRKELSDNYCFFNPEYDRLENIPDWAKKTLKEHENDEREYRYQLEEFENASTHEDLWNAAQREMVITGKMHGYMRMYWAKKILEWSSSPEEALEIAVYLNDKYELDGRDPNGYVGCAWAIAGVHDRAWSERAVYGKIRYMNRNGAKRKFNIRNYIAKWSDTE
jgi:deoxyribodipyrimidine photo-lyase